MGCACESEHTSHYVLVAKKKATPKLCSTPKDYESVKGLTSYFPTETVEETEQGDEIALFDEAHVLPRFVVYYSVGPKDGAPSTPVQTHDKAASTPKSTPSAASAPTPDNVSFRK